MLQPGFLFLVATVMTTVMVSAAAAVVVVAAATATVGPPLQQHHQGSSEAAALSILPSAELFSYITSGLIHHTCQKQYAVNQLQY